MSRLVIGLHGLPGAGKDTIADHLVAEHGFVKIAFADALKSELSRAFSVDLEHFVDRALKTRPTTALRVSECRNAEFVEWCMRHDIPLDRPNTPRWLMQTYGTDYRREQDREYWIDRWWRCAELMGQGGDCIVVPDVRTFNEVRAVRQVCNSSLWRVLRKDNPHSDDCNGHVSNAALPDYLLDYGIWNNGSVEHLLTTVDGALETLNAAQHNGQEQAK